MTREEIIEHKRRMLNFAIIRRAQLLKEMNEDRLEDVEHEDKKGPIGILRKYQQESE